MKKIRLLFLLALSGGYITAFAQNSDFNLKGYQMPEYKRSALVVSSGVNSSNNGTLMTFGQSHSATNFRFNFRPAYSYFANTERYQREFHSQLSMEPMINSHKSTSGLDFTDRIFAYHNQFGVHVVNRVYRNHNSFFEISPIMTGRLNWQSRTQITPFGHYKYKDNLQHVNLRVRLGKGWGRVEDVADAHLAYYIANEMQRNGRLARGLNDDELFALASEITKVRNRRFFDFRDQRIEELTTISNYLQEEAIVTNADILHFTSLYDMWHFGRMNRLSGTRFSFGIAPGASLVKSRYNRSDILVGEVYQVQSFIPEVYVTLENFKPKSIHLQRDYFVTVSGANIFHSSEQNTEILSDIDLKLFQVQAGYNYSIIPNTRTIFTFNNQLNLQNGWGNENYINNPVGKVVHQSLLLSNGLDVHYFLSPQLRFTGGAAFLTKLRNSNSEWLQPAVEGFNNYNLSLSAGFNYQLF